VGFWRVECACGSVDQDDCDCGDGGGDDDHAMMVVVKVVHNYCY
jgi:hypothetical protein